MGRPTEAEAVPDLAEAAATEFAAAEARRQSAATDRSWDRQAESHTEEAASGQMADLRREAEATFPEHSGHSSARLA